MIIKVFIVNDKLGVTAANNLKRLNACSELPGSGDIDENIPVFYVPEKILKFWDGSQYHNLGAPEASLPAITGQGIVDQNNDFEIMLDVPDVLQSATIKLLGLSFPSFFYTEYPAINGTFWSTNVTDGHDHTGSVSGTTGNHNHVHNHEYLNAQGSAPTDTTDDDHTHSHSFSDNFTTAANTVAHKHQTTINFTGSSQKTTFSTSLLQVFITADRSAWGSARSIDVSSLFSTNGTGHIDISSFLTPGSVNFIKFHLNTATSVGGKISYLIKIR